ncbi:MAG: GNAT family N-acetyltransferase [Crocinitomicaceae bacterium]
MELRSVKYEDLDLLFQWANDLDVRRNALSQNPIEFEDHISWFNNRLIDPNCKIYILTEKDKNLGQIRFELNENEWTIDYSVDAIYRGQGIGAKIIQMGMMKLKSDVGKPVKLKALVEENNIGSIRIFQKNEFIESNLVSTDNRNFRTFKRQV